MNMKKSRTLVALIAICLIAVVAFGSIAFFTATRTIENTFTANSDDPYNKIFSVAVFEKGPNGVITDKGLSYTDILPAETYDKAPYAENTGSHSQYVRMHVTFNKLDVWTNALDDAATELLAMLNIADDSKWEAEAAPVVNEEDGTITYTFYYTEKLAKGEKTEDLFTTVTIPTDLELSDLEALDIFNINITADAVQSEKIDAANAQEAFEKYFK